MRAWWLFLALAGCPGGSTSTDDSSATGGCTSTAQCDGDDVCIGPDDGPVCGVPPREECADAAACGPDQVCHAVSDPCSPDGVGSTCAARCDAGTTCETGFSCVDGACRADSCATDASLCAAFEACDPGSVSSSAPVWEQHHGCVRVDCATAATCGGTLACVNGFCQTGLGTCDVPLLVP